MAARGKIRRRESKKGVDVDDIEDATHAGSHCNRDAFIPFPAQISLIGALVDHARGFL